MRASTTRIPPLLRDILIEVAVITVIALAFFVVVKALNRRLGLDEPAAAAEPATSAQPDTLVVPMVMPQPAADTPAEGPESTWPATPCSIFTSGSSGARVLQVPQAPTTAGIPYEVLLVVRAWAFECGTAEQDLQKVYVFNRLDTLYVDLPSPGDTDGLRRTLESRFVCFTRLFVLVGGSLFSDAGGIPVRGVEGGFGN